MKYFFGLLLIFGLNHAALNAASEENFAKSDIIAKNNYNEAVYVPKEWGTLKSVTAHGNFDMLYFEGEDGTIYTVAGYISNDGQFAFSPDAIEYSNSSSMDTEINGSKILRK